MDHCLYLDGDNINNYIVVPDKAMGAEVSRARDRIRSPEGRLTPEEHRIIQEILRKEYSNEPEKLPPITAF